MHRDDNWRHQDPPYPGAHCHAANDLLQYVVFDDAQIIPCYVIHLDLGRDAASYLSKLARNPTDYINEYREQRRKVGGFGAASGLHFVVEAVGDVSEDEEHWGGYQKDRVDNADGDEDEHNIWMNDHGSFALDGEGYHDDDEDPDGDEVGEGRKGEGGDDGVAAWEYEIGPEGRTRFDEYRDARRARSGKRKEGVGRGDRL